MLKSFALINLSIGLIFLISIQLETKMTAAQLLPLPARRPLNVNQPLAQPAADQVQFIEPEIPIQADDNIEAVPDAPPMRKEIPLKMTAHFGSPGNSTNVTVVVPKTSPAPPQTSRAASPATSTPFPLAKNSTSTGNGASTVFFSKGTIITLFLIVSFVFFSTNKRMGL